MSATELHAVDLLIEKAERLGVEVPQAVRDAQQRLRAGSRKPVCGLSGTWAAEVYAERHPDPPIEALTCCIGAAGFSDPARCTCWEPVYSLEQADPVPPDVPVSALPARASMCGDCAFKPGSPERSNDWQAEGLYDLATSGTPFWCHDGMRRPLLWRHPGLDETIEGSPDDWHPPQADGIPYRADGTPALLCAGWAAVSARRSVTP